MFRSPLAFATAFGLLLLTAPAPHAQAAPAPTTLNPDANNVLNQVIAAQKALTGLSATIVVTGMELDGTPVRGKTIMLAFQRPNLAKVTVSGPSGPLRQISTDGVTATMLSVPEKQYISGAAPAAFLLPIILSQAKELLPPSLADSAALTNLMYQPGTTARVGLSTTLGGVAVDTLVIATPLDARAKIKITLAFGHDDHLLRQFIEVATATRSGKVQSLTHTETVTSLTVNPSFSASDFAFTPPAGAKKVPKLAELLMPGSHPVPNAHPHRAKKSRGPAALAKP